MRPVLRLCTLAAGLAFTPIILAAQRVDYTRAERFLPWNASPIVAGDSVRPNWMVDKTRFWYRNKTGSGAEYVLVDPVRNTRSLLFDNGRLAAAMSVARDTAYEPGRLPFTSFRFTDHERAIEFSANRKRFVCVLATYACTVSDTLPDRRRFVVSPDSTTEAFVSGYNVWVRLYHRPGDTTGTRDSVQLTTDGTREWWYGQGDPRPQQQLRRQRQRPPNLRWSPDSRRVAVYREDVRGVGLMPYISYTSQRPRMFTQPYALPGDSIIPKPAVYVIDVASRQSLLVQLPVQPAELSLDGTLRDSVWTADSQHLHFTYQTRASKALVLMEADAATGQSRVLAADSGRTWVETSPQDPASWYTTRDGQDVIWWSERDGWAHLYRFGPDGRLKNQITSGAWAVGWVAHVDEIARQIYFTARGREPGRLLYYAQLYRVNFDGTGLTLITPEDASHELTFSPDGRFFVDSYSRVERPPVTVLRAAPDGRVIRTLETADVSRLAAFGWTPGEVFTTKARDGVTDIYGVMYRPSNFDSTRRYPIVENIYPGPQRGSVGRWEWSSGAEARAVAELGFIVVRIDHLGTPLRSKAFHDNYYGNFGDNGLPDHVAALRQLAARYRWIDIDRVGIWGHSGGGFASTDAMLRYPDFYRVAVSSSGNHDNRSYNIYWAEKYQGLLVRDTVRRTDNFTASANQTLAENLRGHLLLMHGDMDDNVHPAMTIQLINALTRANRDYDFIIAPDRPHSLTEPYFIRRRWDYFVRYLAGMEPPRNYEIRRPEGAGVPAADNEPDEDDECDTHWP
jgi:dipeptidyl aminopeptidase/acylaminoacyl peptidase